MNVLVYGVFCSKAVVSPKFRTQSLLLVVVFVAGVPLHQSRVLHCATKHIRGPTTPAKSATLCYAVLHCAKFVACWVSQPTPAWRLFSCSERTDTVLCGRNIIISCLVAVKELIPDN